MLPLISAFISLLFFTAALAIPSGDEAPSDTPEPPYSYAVVLFPGFAPLDVFGPLGILDMVAHHHGATLSLLAETLDPVSSNIDPEFTFAQSVVPTSTFGEFLSAGGEVDVLIVPGGPGVRVSKEELAPVVELVREAYPGVTYLLTVCTGASIAAQAGILNGKRATTNKSAWGEVTPEGPEVEWVSPARWVVDGNIWSSSGVTAGLDLTAEFMRQMYGDDLVEHALGIIEHTARPQDYDPFAEMFDVPPSP